MLEYERSEYKRTVFVLTNYDFSMGQYLTDKNPNLDEIKVKKKVFRPIILNVKSHRPH